MGFGAIWSAETRHDPFLPLAVASTTMSRIGRDRSGDHCAVSGSQLYLSFQPSLDDPRWPAVLAGFRSA